MKTRWLVVMLAVLLTAAAACDGGDDTEEPTATAGTGETGEPAEFSLASAAEPYAGTEIRILDEVSDLQPVFYEELVPQFEEETGITVNVEIQGHFDVITNGEADLFSGGGAFDAVMLHMWQLPNSLEAQAVQFIDEYMNDSALRDPSVDFANFVQPMTDETTLVDGNRAGFLNWSYNQVWIGRRDLMEHPDEQAAFEDEYGYPLAPPQSLQEMRDIAEFFTRDAGETLGDEELSSPVYGFIQEGARLGATWSDAWYNYIKQFGGDLFDENGTPTADRPENAEGLDFWKSMFEFAPPGAAELSLVDIPVILGEGQAVTGIAWSDFFWTVDSDAGSPHAGNFTYAPVPPNADSPDLHQVNAAPSLLVISNASDNKEATYLFLQWMVSQETQDAWLDLVVNQGLGGFDPILQSSIDNPMYSQGPRAELLAAIAGSVEVGHPTPLIQAFPQFQDPMLQRFQEALLGASAQEALSGLQEDFTAICDADCLLSVE
jgi:multiple sugar transport system substrate-binding protein